MSGQCSGEILYRPLLDRQITTQTIDLIILGTLLPLQFILMVLVFVKGYKRFRKIILRKHHQLIQQQSLKNQLAPKIDKKNKVMQNLNSQTKDGKQQENNKDLIEKIFYQNSSKPKILVTLISFLLLLLLILILLILAFLATYQTVYRNYNEAECELTKSVNQFRKGEGSWIGLENLVPNVTQLNLVLNTRIQVSINAIKGLMLNGTVAKIKPGLGFANGTNITVVNKQSPLNRSIIQSTSVKSNINATVRYWLFMNTSLSNTTFFPVCQPNLTYPIQHPLMTGQTIELNYMDEICQKVTTEVDSLVANGGNVDQLLVDLEDAKAKKTSLQTNLSALNEVYSPISSRTKQYASEFSSFSQNFSTISLLSIITLGSYAGLCIFMVLYVIFMLSIFCCTSDKPDSQQEQSEQSSINIVLSTRQENNAKSKFNKNDKFLNVSSSIPKIFIFLLFGLNIIVGISSFLYVKKSSEISQSCQIFDKARFDTDTFNNLGLQSSQRQLIAPIQQCTSAQSTFFMQSVPLLTSQLTLQKLYSLSDTYNASVPKDVFQAQALLQVDTLKQYLFHLETMPIKSTQFNLLELLAQVNHYSNGSYQNSKQLQECGRAVIQDQYVYNSVDCKHKLMDLVTQVSITEPRCIILPTYDGTPGTVTTRLNEAQHTFVLDATCPSINNMFSQTNTSCFLAKRLAFLQAQNCTKTAAQLGNRLQNLVKFSQKASEYTDIYMQNLRNVFGIYATASTNLTEFYAGSNMTQTMGAFGVLSNNLLNKTKCEQIKPIIDNIYNSYCPQDKSMPKLLSEAYVWSIIVVVAIFVQSVVFFLLDLFLRVYRIQNFYGNAQEERNIRKVVPQNNRINAIEISQQTLVRENIFDNDRIYQDEFNRISQQSPSHHPNHPIIILTENTEPLTQLKHKFQNSHTLDQTGSPFNKETSSPVKSINPYMNSIDEVIEYPKILQTPKKQQPIREHEFSIQKKSQSNEINYLSSIKKKSFIQNEIFNQKDSSVEEQKVQQVKRTNSRQSSQRSGKLMMSQTTRRFKKANFETDQKKIMPQLFFNLDQQQNKNTSQFKAKNRSNTKNHNISKAEQIPELTKPINYLEINLQDEDSGQLQNSRDIEVMNLERINKVKQSKQRQSKKGLQKNESLTAR